MLGKGKLDASVTLIAAGTELAGDVRFHHQLYLNGRIVGDVTALDGSDATLVISDTGEVRGDVRVPNVIVSGRIEGDVHASSRVELTARAQVRGDVHYRLMEMQLGATVDGQLLHHEGEDERGDAGAVGRNPTALAVVAPRRTEADR